jgi:NitT/TauT family transport system substrate-binding protein
VLFIPYGSLHRTQNLTIFFHFLHLTPIVKLVINHSLVQVAMPYNRRIFLTCSAIALANLALIPQFYGCHSKEAPLRVATTTWIGSEFFHLAEHLGLYQDKPFKLITMPSSTSVMRAIATDSVEVASLTLDEVLTLAAQNVPINILAVVDISHGADVVLAKPHVNSTAQLKGKHIAVEQSAVGAIMLYDLLHYAQLSLAEVTIEYFTIDQHMEAFNLAHIDVVITYEPVASKLRALGGHAIYSSAQNDAHIIDVIIATDKALAKAQHSLVQLMQGFWQAQQQYLAKPEQHQAWLQQRLDLTAPQISQAFTGIKLPSLADNVNWYAGAPSKLLTKANDIQNMLLDAKIIAQPVDLHKIITPNIVSALAL